MRAEITRIRQLLQATFDGDPWHGPSLMHTLKGITAIQAATKPFIQAHTIWELVAHLTAWRTFTLEKISGKVSYDISTPEQDWPRVVQTGEQAWQQTLQDFRQSQLALLQKLQEPEDALLEKVVPGRNYTFYVLLHGIIKHNVYHCGQIALLKKHM